MQVEGRACTLELTAIATASSRSAHIHEHVPVAPRGVDHRHGGVLLQCLLEPVAPRGITRSTTPSWVTI